MQTIQKNYFAIPLFFLFIFLFTSCQELILGEEETNTPENNFEIFWKDFDEHYSLFSIKNSNWDSIYTVYRPQINEQTTNEELFTTFTTMIEYLDDSHTAVYTPYGNSTFYSGTKGDDRVREEFSFELLTDKYLENITRVPVYDPDDVYGYAKIKDKDIGYIYLNGMEITTIDAMHHLIDETKNYKAIILDIRSNFGGDDAASRAIAGRFADERNFVYTEQYRNGKNKTDFSEKVERYTKPSDKERFLKPVIILTDNITISAAEIFLLHMKSFSHVTQIGDTTSGSFSTVSMRRFLPNGFQYQYSIMKLLLPNGKSLEGIGHVPDIQIRNTVNDIENQNDKVIEKAIDYLLEEYGIE
ncbi:periplasmic protease [Bernardetia litoralis DSM 6794]|uniref:Periplasmic protease n=1 Tax=Bernardetia litoralis (strain ATCC 23117 / DSM 6794 / NBRC 15988 / NCIMB 1366 / Fx l1 / Sio-4) TaxID=880071 RepID=I4AF74_BERLS|nr:S41 family peptidase [Bernardetia litoralis]AFM02609.1 periplasmic protease [Bernardetia litoralis DSM 6794]